MRNGAGNAAHRADIRCSVGARRAGLVYGNSDGDVEVAIGASARVAPALYYRVLKRPRKLHFEDELIGAAFRRGRGLAGMRLLASRADDAQREQAPGTAKRPQPCRPQTGEKDRRAHHDTVTPARPDNSLDCAP